MINFKEIIRSTIRNKTISILSISGMSIAIAIVLMIGFWSMNEFSFDNFHDDADQIYRVCVKGIVNDKPMEIGGMYGPVGPMLKDKLSEIESMLRVKVLGDEIVEANNLKMTEKEILTVDKNFFSFYNYQLLYGKVSECLNSGNKIVIDEFTAIKYFQKSNAIGQIIHMYDKDFEVSAVMKNIPKNSHLQANFIIPLSGLDWLVLDKWGSSDSYITYLKLYPEADIMQLNKKITALVNENFIYFEQIGITEYLQPLKDIHFSSEMRFDFIPKGDKRITIIFLSLAGLILLIASFNFINLSISTSFLKTKSVGVKKVIGCTRTSLFLHSYIETGLYVLVSFIIGILITINGLPFFKQLSASDFTIHIYDYRLYVFSILMYLLITLIAGTVPVYQLLKFNPEAIIRNRVKREGISGLQRILVIIQLAATIILLICAGAINKQIYFIQHKNLGFDKEHVLYFTTGNLATKYDAIRQSLKNNPNIIDISSTENLPFNWNNGNQISKVEDPSVNELMEIVYIKENYLDLLKIPIIQGQNPFLSNHQNSDKCLINESGLSKLHMEDPIGKQIQINDEAVYTIAGILKDVNTKSLHNTIDPQVYVLDDKIDKNQYMVVRVTNNIQEAVSALSQTWIKYNPEEPFEYHFLDTKYNELYKTEATASKIMSIGLVIAIFLAIMGLYAIAFYATERRVKEIGIRKVNGAKTGEVMLLLTIDFMKWIIIAFVISVPIAYYAMHKWLENFAYKTELSWWIFLLAGVFAFAVAMFTVGIHSYKTATSNPVEALKYE